MPENVETLRGTWTTVEGLRVYARVAEQTPGGAAPIVLVHGIGVSGRYMTPTAARLAPNHAVYVPDLLGSGRSEGPSRALTIVELADFLAAWMTTLGLDRAVLLGNSFGCQVIVEFALRHPARIERAVLAGPTGDPSQRSPLRLLLRLLWDSFQERPSEVLIAIRDYWRFGMRRGIATLRMMTRDRMVEKLSRMTTPTLVVRGGRDAIVTQPWAETVAALLPEGQLAVIPGAAHAVNYDVPAALAEAVERFLDGREEHAGRIAAPTRAGHIERRSVTVDGRIVRYRVAGAGNPVVLVHGLSGSFRWWARNIGPLSAHVQIFAIDLPGFGDNRRGGQFALEATAAHILAWMDAVGIERASIAGHSMGGAIAADLTASAPGRVERLVLVDVPLLPSARGLIRLAAIGAASARRLPPRFLPVLVSDALRAGPLTIRNAARALLAADLRPRLGCIQAPSLVIWGARDALFPVAYGQRVAEALPGADFAVIEHAGHNPMWDQPAAFNRLVLDFLTPP